jgi:hypothetical protein
MLFRGFFSPVVPPPPPTYGEIQSFCSQEASNSNLITILLSRGICVVLIAIVFVCRLNFAVHSARCIRPGHFVDTEHMLGVDMTPTDINGEQKSSADDKCGGGDCIGNTVICGQFLLKLRIKILKSMW